MRRRILVLAAAAAVIDSIAKEQAKTIAKELRAQGRYVDADKEVVALIAYLQSLGKTWSPIGAPTAAASGQSITSQRSH